MNKVNIKEGGFSVPQKQDDSSVIKCVVMFQYGERLRDYAVYFDTTKEVATHKFTEFMNNREQGDIELDGWDATCHVTFTENNEVHIQDTSRLAELGNLFSPN